MNLWWLIVAGVGLLVAGWSVANARQAAIPAVEVRVFETINGPPAGLLVALLDHDLGVALGEVHQSTCSRSRLVHRGVA